MPEKIYIVDGRQFRTESDYRRACRDHDIIEKLREELKKGNQADAVRIKNNIKSGKYNFYTMLGQDFLDEIEDFINKKNTDKTKKTSKGVLKEKSKSDSAENRKGTGKAATVTGTKGTGRKKNSTDTVTLDEKAVNSMVSEELKKREKRRKIIVALCSVAAAGCVVYLALYSYYTQRTNATYDKWSQLKEQSVSGENTTDSSGVVIHYDTDTKDTPEVLDEYKNLLNKNQKLIGWVKIDDTNIDYPVMQTTDNEYYLDHNLNQEYDKNGSIFMDKDCDVLKPSTNFILYGHHMKSGQMFGGLDKYQNQSYAEKHPYISFDTIYEHGTYQVMYVFRSKVYSEEDVNFKYYQFIDALSETEFESNMQEMASMSLYDTGVTAQYGDRLLTLSTCDYQEKNGRFVVVAKKID
jgi:sortase B